MRLTGYPVFFLTVSRLKKSGGLNNPSYVIQITIGQFWADQKVLFDWTDDITGTRDRSEYIVESD